MLRDNLDITVKMMISLYLKHIKTTFEFYTSFKTHLNVQNTSIENILWTLNENCNTF